MPYRKTPIVAGEIYHVFNISVAKQPIFISTRDYRRTIELINYYRFKNPRLRFSFYNRLPVDEKQQFLIELMAKGEKIVEIICYCLMPNHFHFLLKNLTENGIVKFISNLQNSYAKYFNTKNARSGALFQAMFKAVRVGSDEQLTHVSRYIHLNPVTAYFVKDTTQLTKYPWSSYSDYLSQSSNIVQKTLILDHFKSTVDYENFVRDQQDYQRELDKIKHLILE